MSPTDTGAGFQPIVRTTGKGQTKEKTLMDPYRYQPEYRVVTPPPRPPYGYAPAPVTEPESPTGGSKKPRPPGWVWVALAVAIVLMAGAAVLGVMAVSSDEDERPAQAPSATPSHVSLADQDAAFYRWVLRHPWSQNGNTQEDWTGLAGSMCGAFDRGGTYDEIATILVQDLDDFSTADAHEFVTEAVSIYCPEHAAKVN